MDYHSTEEVKIDIRRLTPPVLKAASIKIGYRFSKKDYQIVADDLSFTIKAGELTCLVGPNGVGKSTLLRSICGLQPLLAGEIWIYDKKLSEISQIDLAKQVAVVLTSSINVGALRAFDVVALGRHPYTNWSGRMSHNDDSAVMDALLKVDAVKLSDRQFNTLSDGERQKILIARALAQEPHILLLDEPTAYLDLSRRVMLMQMLRSLAHDWGKAILISTHDLDLAMQSSDVIWIMGEDGSMSSGAPEDLVLSGQFEKIFAQQGVKFDNKSGSFLVVTPSETQISLKGTGLPYRWTSHALKRTGYEVIKQPELAQKYVEIIQCADKNIWRLCFDGKTIDCDSIYSLLLTLSE